MDLLREYILTVVAAALVCGILTGFLPIGEGKGILRMLCGLFLAFTALRPITGLNFNDIGSFAVPYMTAAEDIAATGEKLARESQAAIIKSRTEEYILDKAASLGMDLQVDVTVDGDNPPLPVSVTITGAAGPLGRQRLQAILEQDVGIPKEEQIWNG